MAAHASLPQGRGDPSFEAIHDGGHTSNQSLGKRTGHAPREVFSSAGVVLLTMLCVVPVWNSVVLLMDENYVFWAGIETPLWLLGSCLGVVMLYGATIFLFFGHARPQVQTESTMMMIAILFVCLLGVIMMLVSVSLTKESLDTYESLMHHCDYSFQTHRVFEYSQVLHNIRRQPLCMQKMSVEECKGYEEYPPYTDFLRHMESNFHCSGFCYRTPFSKPVEVTPALTAPPTSSNGVKVEPVRQANVQPDVEVVVIRGPDPSSSARHLKFPSAFVSAAANQRHQHHEVSAIAEVSAKGRMLLSYDRSAVRRVSSATSSNQTEKVAARQPEPEQRTSEAAERIAFRVATSRLDGAAAERAPGGGLRFKYPPALFSDAKYHSTCDGMSARHMKSYAGDIGHQSFYQGIYLVFVAILCGFLKLLGFCMYKDRDVQYLQPDRYDRKRQHFT